MTKRDTERVQTAYNAGLEPNACDKLFFHLLEFLLRKRIEF